MLNPGRSSSSFGSVLTKRMGHMLHRLPEYSSTAAVQSWPYTGSPWQQAATAQDKILDLQPRDTPAQQFPGCLDLGNPSLEAHARGHTARSTTYGPAGASADAQLPQPTGDVIQGALCLLHQPGSRGKAEGQLLQETAISRPRKAYHTDFSHGPTHPVNFAVGQLGWVGWEHYRMVLMQQQQDFSTQVSSVCKVAASTLLLLVSVQV